MIHKLPIKPKLCTAEQKYFLKKRQQKVIFLKKMKTKMMTIYYIITFIIQRKLDPLLQMKSNSTLSFLVEIKHQQTQFDQISAGTNRSSENELILAKIHQ